MSWHCTVLRARELFVLRMRTLTIQYPDPWGKSAIPNKENSPPCPGRGVRGGLTLIGALVCDEVSVVKVCEVVYMSGRRLDQYGHTKLLFHHVTQDLSKALFGA